MIDVRALLDAMAQPTSLGQGVRVAVIDTGVETHHPLLRDTNVRATHPAGHPDGAAYLAEDPQSDPVGHGTAVISRLLSVAPRCEVVSIRILGRDRTGTTARLLQAFQALRNEPVHLINLSLSTSRPDQAAAMSLAIDELFASGITCFAAKGYAPAGRDYPASLAGVIGVSYDQLNPTTLVYRSHDATDFDAPGVAVPIAWINGSTRHATGSSYACPVATGLAARLLTACPGLTPFEIRSLLKACAHRQAQGWDPGITLSAPA